MKNIISEVKRNTPRSVPGYYYLKTQKIYIPFMKITVECLTRRISELNLFFESILRLIDISISDINEIADILGVSYGIVKEAVIDMVEIDYIYTSENTLGITTKGVNALKTKQRVDIKRAFLKDVMVDTITGAIFDADTVKTTSIRPRDVLLEGVIQVDSCYLDSHFQEINSLYQAQLKNNSIFADSAITSELYKIVGISYSELHYVENKVHIFKSESSDDLKFEFVADDNDRYKNEFYNQLKDSYRPCQEYFFEKSRAFLEKSVKNPLKINPSILERTETARKLLFADNPPEGSILESFTQERYSLNDQEYMSYLYHAKDLKCNRIILCSDQMNNFLSSSLCSQLNVLSDSIPVYIIYHPHEPNVEKTIGFFFKNTGKHLFLVPSNEIKENLLCFDSELIIHLLEGTTLAFDRPIRFLLPVCNFDKTRNDIIIADLCRKHDFAEHSSKNGGRSGAIIKTASK